MCACVIITGTLSKWMFKIWCTKWLADFLKYIFFIFTFLISKQTKQTKQKIIYKKIEEIENNHLSTWESVSRHLLWLIWMGWFPALYLYELRLDVFMRELTGDSCAIPTHVWVWLGGSLQFPGSSLSVGSAARLCTPGHSHSDDMQTCRERKSKTAT